MAKENADLGLDEEEEEVDEDEASSVNDDEGHTINGAASPDDAVISSALDDLSLSEPVKKDDPLLSSPTHHNRNVSAQLGPQPTPPIQTTPAVSSSTSYNPQNDSEGDDLVQPTPSTSSQTAPPSEQMSKKDKRRAREAAKKAREAESNTAESESQVCQPCLSSQACQFSSPI